MPDEMAFAAFAVGHAPRLLRSARLLSGDWYAAEDLVQDALVRLYVAWPRLRDPAAAEDYARRTMVRLHVRGRSRLWNGEVPTGSLPERAYIDAPQEDAELVAALRGLPPRQRATIVLRFFEDMSVLEVARTLRCSTSTVKKPDHEGSPHASHGATRRLHG